MEELDSLDAKGQNFDYVMTWIVFIYNKQKLYSNLLHG